MPIIRFKPEIAAMVVIGQGQASGLPVGNYQREITDVFAQLAQHGVFLAGIEEAPLVQQIYQSLGVQQSAPMHPQPMHPQHAPLQPQPMQPQHTPPQSPPRIQPQANQNPNVTPLEMPNSVVTDASDQPLSLTQSDNRPTRPQIID